MADLTCPAAEWLNRAPRLVTEETKYNDEYNRIVTGDSASEELFSQLSALWDRHNECNTGGRRGGSNTSPMKCVGRGRNSRVFRCSAEIMKVGFPVSSCLFGKVVSVEIYFVF